MSVTTGVIGRRTRPERRARPARPARRREPVALRVVEDTEAKARPRAVPGAPRRDALALTAVVAGFCAFGLVVVLSSSSVASISSYGSPWSLFERQGMWTAVGAAAFALTARHRSAVLAADGGAIPRHHGGAAAGGAGPRRRLGSGRLVTLDRLRHVAHPALRARQAGRRLLRRRPPRPSGEGGAANRPTSSAR